MDKDTFYLVRFLMHQTLNYLQEYFLISAEQDQCYNIHSCNLSIRAVCTLWVLRQYEPKVIYPKYSKHRPYILACIMDCDCRKMLNHGLNHESLQYSPTYSITDYGHPDRKLPSLNGRKSTPTPKFLGTAKAYFVCQSCQSCQNFQVSLIYAFIGCP
jgi:hypothetical protein